MPSGGCRHGRRGSQARVHARWRRPDLWSLKRWRAAIYRRLLVHTRPYDGIVEVVRTLGMSRTLALLTNKPEAPSLRLLQAFDLAGSFRRIIGGDSGVTRKPDPAGLLAVMSEFGVGPRHTWLVGDSMIDIDRAPGGRAMCVTLMVWSAAADLDGTEALVQRRPNSRDHQDVRTGE
jgi:phosphoglycolate phosphatase-like HAD superfamily hydrolase